MQSSSSIGALFFIFLLFAWACFGYWGGRVAQGKGYSFGLGFAVGFFGGLIGIVILYIIKPARRREDYLRQYPPPTSHHYGAPPGPPPDQPAPRNKVCNQCHNLVPWDAQFCTYCGANISGTPTW